MDLEPVDPYRSLLYDAGYGLCDECDPESVDLGIQGVLENFYQGSDAAQVLEELNRLFRAYRTELEIGRTHFSPSPTWRDEYLLDYALACPTRFAVRVHVFERTCRKDQHGKHVGKYLGFVALRPPDIRREESNRDNDVVELVHGGEDQGYHHVIEAEITTPAHMLRPRYHLITTNSSSARLGVMPFRSAVFMAPRFDDERRKTTCVHLALSQALHLVMGRFGCKPVSQREFDWQLAKQGNQQSATAGVRLDEALKVLDEQCDCGGFIANFIVREGYTEKQVKMDALRCLTDTLANGMPVIMMVSEDLLPVYPSTPGTAAHETTDRAGSPTLSAAEEKGSPASHAALILGMHLLHSPHEIPDLDLNLPLPEDDRRQGREDHAELPGRLVGHDVLQGPFSEWTAERLLNSALRLEPLRGVHFLAVGPRGLRLGLDKIREAARGFVAAHLQMKGRLQKVLLRYCESLQCCAEAHREEHLREIEHWRFVIRLMSEREVRSRYNKGRDWQPQSGELQRGYYWGVELWHPSAQSVPNIPVMLPALMMLWDATQPAVAEGSDGAVFPLPSAVLLWNVTSMDEWVLRRFRPETGGAK
ncbi:MAG: hypothetical protein KDK99_13745 [Verrucomicrobiales bacterium]|nr:hypothetical protein [Verrucomicrobiales bacterium]